MATDYKVLGQSTPGAGSVTDIYTVPGATTAVISSITFCNRTAIDKTIRLSIAVAGAADTIAQYVAYDMVLPANDTIFIQIGITLGAADVVRALVSATGVTINVFGLENT